MKYVFGPVPSRRLGQSLGIDPIPMKTCNWNCVYCQLGRSSRLDDQRHVYAPPEEIVAEVLAAVAAHGSGAIDWLTFVGSGEPTLHLSLGQMIRELRQRTQIPVAVLTNGSLLDLPEVRRDLAAADAVLPSLDAGSEAVYRRLNRAAKEWSFERLVRGLLAFRAEYAGKLWVEVMLVQGLNDSEEALLDLARVLHQLRPDEVHLNVPVRPPAEPWVVPPAESRLERATEILGQVARVVTPRAPLLQLSGSPNVLETILEVIARHPLAEDEITNAVAQWQPAAVDQVLRQLVECGRARSVLRGGQRFWTGAQARYVDESLSRCHSAPRPES
jgi:wyosine [tRNA(Phe)-imidazoG37] synthetase (radical SAM superfamily)